MRVSNVVLLCLCFATVAVLSQDVNVDASAVASTAPWWKELVTTIIMAIGTLFIIPLLHRKQQEAQASVAALEAKQDLTNMEKRKLLSERLKSFLLRTAEVKVERDFPAIARDVIDGKLKSSTEIKILLKKMGADLKAEAIDYFGLQGINLVAAVGDDALDDLIRWAADKVSPFPGKETAVAFLTDSGSNQLIKYGTNFLKDRIQSAVPAQ